MGVTSLPSCAIMFTFLLSCPRLAFRTEGWQSPKKWTAMQTAAHRVACMVAALSTAKELRERSNGFYEPRRGTGSERTAAYWCGLQRLEVNLQGHHEMCLS